MKPNAIPAAPKNHDALLLGVATVALCLEIAALLAQLRLFSVPFLWDSMTGNRPAIGNVVKKARSVQDRAPGSLSWYPMVEGDAVSQNDTVMTGAGSQAVIRLHDGSEIAMEPFTLIRFSEKVSSGSGLLALEVNRGSFKVRSKQNLRFAMRDREVALKPQSEVVVTASAVVRAPQPAALEVVTGSAHIESQSEQVDLTAGQALVTTREIASLDDSKTSPPMAVVTRLQPQVVSPAANSHLFFRGTQGQVQFSWQGEKAEYLEWDFHPSMPNPHRMRLEGNTAVAGFPTGHYYWRLVRGPSHSSVYDFSIQPQAQYRIGAVGGKVKAKEGSEANLQWEPVKDAEGYLLELSKDASFRTVDRKFTLTTNELDLKGLGVGNYFWRVRALHSFLGDWPVSPVYGLSVKKRIEAPQLNDAKIVPRRIPAKKPHGSVWPKVRDFIVSLFVQSAWAAEPEKIWLEFSWKPSKGAKSYRLEVSHRKDFKSITVSTEGARTAAVLEVPDRETYFWRVAAIDEDGDLGKFSSVRTVRRAVARVAPPKQPARDVAQIPVAPVVPNRVVDAVKSQTPEVFEPPRARAWRLWTGYGATYLRQSIQGTGFTSMGSGMPINRIVLGASTDFERSSLEAHSWVQPLVYQSAFQANYVQLQWGLDAFWSNLLFRHSLPIGFGVRVRPESTLSSFSGSTATLAPEILFGALIGTHWQVDGEFAWKATLSVEIAALGSRTGVGVISRNRFALPVDLGSMKPSLELVVHPQYRRGTLGTELNLEASAALVIEWVNVLPTISARTLPRS